MSIIEHDQHTERTANQGQHEQGSPAAVELSPAARRAELLRGQRLDPSLHRGDSSDEATTTVPTETRGGDEFDRATDIATPETSGNGRRHALMVAAGAVVAAAAILVVALRGGGDSKAPANPHEGQDPNPGLSGVPVPGPNNTPSPETTAPTEVGDTAISQRNPLELGRDILIAMGRGNAKDVWGVINPEEEGAAGQGIWPDYTSLAALQRRVVGPYAARVGDGAEIYPVHPNALEHPTSSTFVEDYYVKGNGTAEDESIGFHYNAKTKKWVANSIITGNEFHGDVPLPPIAPEAITGTTVDDIYAGLVNNYQCLNRAKIPETQAPCIAALAGTSDPRNRVAAGIERDVDLVNRYRDPNPDFIPDVTYTQEPGSTVSEGQATIVVLQTDHGTGKVVRATYTMEPGTNGNWEIANIDTNVENPGADDK